MLSREQQHLEPLNTARVKINPQHCPSPMLQTGMSEWVGSCSPKSGPGDEMAGGTKLSKGTNLIFFSPNMLLLPAGFWKNCDFHRPWRMQT